mmetsp:Transcript_60210/g.140261  ORF Transcript_60210/g.140261 Transcript_60210/m.140261 type:complete len:97 (+) Transcript_60210:189-479(+)
MALTGVPQPELDSSGVNTSTLQLLVAARCRLPWLMLSETLADHIHTATMSEYRTQVKSHESSLESQPAKCSSYPYVMPTAPQLPNAHQLQAILLGL